MNLIIIAVAILISGASYADDAGLKIKCGGTIARGDINGVKRDPSFNPDNVATVDFDLKSGKFSGQAQFQRQS